MLGIWVRACAEMIVDLCERSLPVYPRFSGISDTGIFPGISAVHAPRRREEGELANTKIAPPTVSSINSK